MIVNHTALALTSSWQQEMSYLAGNVTADLAYPQGVNLSVAFRDITRGLPVKRVTLVFDDHVDDHFPPMISQLLHASNILTIIYTVVSDHHLDLFCSCVRGMLNNREEMTSIVFAAKHNAERIILKLISEDLIHRNLLYMFAWDWSNWPISGSLRRQMVEAMRVAFITSPREGTQRVYYSQASPRDKNHLTLVNWWTLGVGLFRFPVLPPVSQVYQNFLGRLFLIPVLNKPPWHFVLSGSNDSSVTVTGGRDDTLLEVLASKLNFRYEYFTPEDRSQGSAIGVNGTFPGILGLIWQREVEFCLGDVTITYERSCAVEFSFLTLADSGAFVTRAPGRLNEALALIRSFQWQVWPLVVATLLFSGPVLFALIELPTRWRHRRRSPRMRKQLFWNCIWFITTIFLRQSGREPGNSHKARLVMILLSFAATYVIGDMYSANLTSMLARPGREPPIINLEQLETAMKMHGYQLLVEKDGSSYSILKNGTGVYERVWRLMERQKTSLIESVEEGIKHVRDKERVALLGGRETLYFDTRRFGAHNFHLSEKLYTRYSAIALQIGCPFLERFNQILMQLFEAGILTKMTEEEYEKLGEHLRATAVNEDDEELDNKHDVGSSGKLQPTMMSTSMRSNDDRLQPINIKMLQGAFFVLICGCMISGVALLVELSAVWGTKNCHLRVNADPLRCFRRVKFRYLHWKQQVAYHLFSRGSSQSSHFGK